MAEEKVAKQGAIAVPPYLSYKTFVGFINSLKVGIPTRIDRSVLSSMSGGVQAQLMAALRYLGLVSQHGVTTDRLAAFVNSEGAERERVFAALLKEAYPFLFNGFDLQRGTTGELEEVFRKVGASGDTIRKCVAFFLAAAKAASIPVSPHIKTAGISRGPGRSKKGTNGGSAKPLVEQDEEQEKDPPTAPAMPPMASWQQLLLAKFPSLDPAWAPEVQTKWFESFDRLMKLGDSKGGGSQ